MMHDLIESGKSKMAASKLQMNTSQLRDKISTIQLQFVNILHVLTGSGKSNMMAAKPEVTISQLVDKIGTKSQWLFQYCWVQLTHGTSGCDADRPNRK